VKRGGYLERRTPIERGESLRATQWGTRPKKPDPTAWRAAFMPEMLAPPAPKYTAFEIAWFAFVRTFPCCAAHLGSCDGDIVAAHAALSANQKGMGMKVPHDQTVSLCWRHHGFFDGALGEAGNPFAGMTREERYEMARPWVEAVRKAAIPGDSRDDALALEEIGIGRVVGDAAAWHWVPGGDAEVAA
jgi:hypothetical protein